MRTTLGLLTLVAAFALGGCRSAGESWEDSRSRGMTGFNGRLDRVAFDENGNTAIPGEFRFVDGAAEFSRPGWLVSASPESPAEQLRRARIIPGKGYYLDDSPGQERNRQRPVPDTLEFDGALWRVVLTKDDAGYEKTLTPPFPFFATAGFLPAEGTRVLVTYDNRLILNQLMAKDSDRRTKEILGMMAVTAVVAAVSLIDPEKETLRVLAEQVADEVSDENGLKTHREKSAQVREVSRDALPPVRP